MWGLLLTTILTSAVDSLNPIAITQQFALQGMVEKPKHILYFIIPTGVTNLIGGFLAYYGIIALIADFMNNLIEKYGQALFTAELIVGIAFLVLVGIMLQNKKIESLTKQIKLLQGKASTENNEAEAARRIKSVSPFALVTLGVGATISELTSALPYYAFLTVLFNYRLTLLQVSLILIVYNFIYTLPLIILYFVYLKAQDKFDRLYRVIKTQVSKISNILAPTVAGAVGVFLIYHSLSLLI